MSSCLIQLGAGFSGCPGHSNSTSPPGGLEESSIGTSCEERREGARRKRGSALAARSLCEGYSRSVLIVVAVDRTLASGGRGNTRCVARTHVRLVLVSELCLATVLAVCTVCWAKRQRDAN